MMDALPRWATNIALTAAMGLAAYTFNDLSGSVRKVADSVATINVALAEHNGRIKTLEDRASWLQAAVTSGGRFTAEDAQRMTAANDREHERLRGWLQNLRGDIDALQRRADDQDRSPAPKPRPRGDLILPEQRDRRTG